MNPDDYLAMSGIQHFCFCRRQWALIHLEGLWAENLRTAEGRVEHARCHDETFAEKRGDLLTVRGMRVISHRLKLSGSCDVVEFRADPAGIPLPGRAGLWRPLPGRAGLWRPLPVEYKHGEAKESDADRLQLCAQAMALEEMLVCEVPRGALFYERTRRREIVELTPVLRQTALDMAGEMNRYFARGYTPRVKPGRHCNACSLKDVCLPRLGGRLDAKKYLRERLEEVTAECGSC